MVVPSEFPSEESVSNEELLTLASRVAPSSLRRLVEVESLRWRVFPFLASGFVCLVDVMGDDAAIAQAARTSYGHGTRKVSDDEVLINYLMRHRHSTPFEMAEIKLLVRVPMDCWRQWIRHRTASVNEYSTRYSLAIDEADATPPGGWRLQSQSNRQGSEGVVTDWPDGYGLWPVTEEEQPLLPGVILDNDDAHLHWAVVEFEPDSQSLLPAVVLEVFHGKKRSEITPGCFLSAMESRTQLEARSRYEIAVERFGVAREQARKNLPLSTYTQAYWKIDLHNLFQFLFLRMDSHAQAEIREAATVIGTKIVQPLFPIAWQAFERHRLRAMQLSEPAQQILRLLVSTAAESLDPTSDNVGRYMPPYGSFAFERSVLQLFPAWMPRSETGKLLPHREREEVRRALISLGVLKAD